MVQPSYELSAPFLNRDEKEEITDQLRDILSSSLGMPVVFSLVECVKEFLEQPHFLQKSISNANSIVEEIQPKVHAQRLSSVQCPVITTGNFNRQYGCISNPGKFSGLGFP